MEQIPALSFDRIAVKFFITGNTPDIGGQLIVLFKYLLRLDDFVKDGAAAQQMHLAFGLLKCRFTIKVHPLQNPLSDRLALGHGRHGVGFIGHRQIINKIFLVTVHARQSFVNNHCQFIGKGRIVSLDPRGRQGQNLAVAVLVLQTFTGQGRAPAGGPDEEATRTAVAGLPDLVTDPLKAKHGIEGVKGNGLHPVVGMGGACGNETGHGTGFA